ncbi:hypothetical protein [Roseovarius aestuarii]|uniref:hypothetical protein n=1 Tax=Roseovarius aestuarii TaxID=475083 RepID=UPI001CBB8AF9|nr:hypothetical protein [Roseovarius aestuarii]
MPRAGFAGFRGREITDGDLTSEPRGVVKPVYFFAAEGRELPERVVARYPVDRVSAASSVTRQRWRCHARKGG